MIAFASPNSLWDKENMSMAQPLRQRTNRLGLAATPVVGPFAVPMDIETAEGHWRDGKWIDFDPVAPPGAEVGGPLAGAQPQRVRK
jgi:hypothetical protein